MPAARPADAVFVPAAAQQRQQRDGDGRLPRGRGDRAGPAPLAGDPARPPRFLNREAVAKLVAENGELDFAEHLWPLLAKDAAYGYYRELFTGHPDRVSMGWPEFDAGYAAVDWYSAGRRELVEHSVPRHEDRLEFESLDRPLDGAVFSRREDLQRAVAEHIAGDLELRDGGRNTETLGLFLGLLGVYMELGRLVPLDALNKASRATVSGWWHGFFSYVDSGPPAHRLRELLALHRAGLVEFLGPDTRFGADESSGMFTAHSASLGQTFAARTLVEARLPHPTLSGSANPVLRFLHDAGIAAEEATGTGKLLVDAERRVVGPDGSARAWLFAVGAGVSGWGGGAFARPHSNAAPFRDTDALARSLLGTLAESPPAAADASTAAMSESQLAASVADLHRYVG